ncbi:hypothetical protein IE53DRAFT_4469 [Violaceomyces palustris]|uniref:Uncharacterized protein n=1 Tax=Violaceomyces palustris TaxID=1673888 RepID=A0ACD0NM20_9BASI|nr:hypothetical protein IE53DRAFT_4469 [Violaceomyces palustris]
MRIGIITDTNDLAHLLQNATVEDFGEFTRIAQSMDVDLSSFYYILYTYNNEIGLLRALLYTAVGWWFWELLTTLKIEKDIIQGKMSLPSRIPVVSVLIMRFSTTMLLIFSMFLQESTLHDCNLNARLCVFFQGLTKTSSTALFIHMASVLWKENFWISKVLLPFLVLLNFSTSLYKVSGTRGLRLENLPLIGDVNGCVTPRFVIAPNAVDSATMIAVAMITILLLNVRLAATSSRTILGKDLIYRVYAFALLNLALPMTLLVVLYCDLTSGLQSVIQIVTVAAISIASSRAYSYLNKVATKYKRAMNFGRTTGVGFDGDRKRFFGNAANLFVNTQRDDGLGEGETDRGWEGGEVLEEDEVGEKSVEVVEEIKDDPSNIDLEKAMSISRNQSAQSRKSDDFDEVDDAAQHFKETSGSSSQTEVSAPRSRKVEDDQRAWNQEESEGVEETSNSSLGSGKDRKISRKMVPRRRRRRRRRSKTMVQSTLPGKRGEEPRATAKTRFHLPTAQS